MLFDGQTIKVEALHDGVVELRLERSNETVNKLDNLTFGELRRALQAIAETPAITGVLVTSGKEAFVVGADIFEFRRVFAKSEQEVEDFVAQNSRIITALNDLPVPTVAAINGHALGGGLELALAADYRVMSATASIGFPEVNLGLFPGYGGTVRLPRLIGLAASADWIVSGAPQTPGAALAAGAIDKVAPPDALRASALAELQEAIDGRADWRRRRADLNKGIEATAGEIETLLAPAKAAAAKALPHLPAAQIAVGQLEASASLPRDEALALEAKAFARAAKTQAADSLVAIFINEQALRKIARTYAKTAAPIRKAAVVGAGVMGGGIAYQSAARGTPIIMKDIAQAALDLGMGEAQKLLARQVETGKLKQDKADAIAAAISPGLTYAGFEGVDIVIEAVVENIKVKHAVLGELERAIGDHAILTSNTSSIRIADLTEGLARPENFLGMHFFNPVPRMPLVEVIRGPKTSDAAIAATVGYALAMGKIPVVMGDCPGFVVNRTLAPYFLAFLRLVQDGVHYTAIDRAMERFGWPMGPAYLIDVIGMDISHHLIEIICAGFPDRMQAPSPDAIDILLREKRLGQKNGHGFYAYAPDAKGRPRKAVDPETDRLLAAAATGGAREASEAEIVERMMLPLIFEVARCVEEGVVNSPGEADMCLILGLGMPRYLGGALKYADHLGPAHCVARAAKWADLGAIYAPSEKFAAMAAKGEAFYPL
ncbi:fatty acid oxidation complex subunit alpha FadB [Methylocapsa palsarum]|uniref:enoyl-CoA hydratase n=1 Tax=Methylocapsa palsarum TaxID=1612308 RepID=A0A1I3XK46_9HYPH|nr:fatty acid oxidation complex subunit alpha FadB [Methylocapsa palsarum]SFK19848.1 3-hydroxyacyl-CoA dehydrogenase / enoyl-CoA hydratase / 3-hydroxybutyryl-CoA epimerase / enoyl-CoA isomerase [Methylocapsa palsarum]